ncbi:BON domain-containing protein [Undibacterium sp. Ji83W]|uniref:BON domain-containing protein n=1 Tax=Undibacterium sp. Ji83W TaxID=3413043 RepID=UPI003BF0E3A7
MMMSYLLHTKCIKYILPLLSASLLLMAGCNKGADGAASNASTTIGVEIDDSVITTKVKTALMSDDIIKGTDVKIETRKGEVLLSGFADNQAQIDHSAAVAMAIEGVKKVDNKLVLKEGKQTVGNKIDDSVITAGIKTAMLQDTQMKSMDVAVVTRKGEVQLSGFVDSELQATHAIEVAKSVSGVQSVINNLKVKN